MIIVSPRRIARTALVCLATGALAASLGAQAPPARDSATRAARAERPPRPPRPPTRFYDSMAVLEVTLTANFRQLGRDRVDGAPWRAATIGWRAADGAMRAMPARVRTRGLWRLKQCAIPPMRLDFARAAAVGTPFEGVNRPRLVNVCRNEDRYEQYLLQEHQLYRVQALLLPLHLRSRLVRMTYVDSASGKVELTRHAMIVEEDQALAERVGAKLVEAQGAGPDLVDAANTASLALFQYMIGNTDWSIWGLHNVVLLQKDSTLHAVAYDYDFAGAIDAHYATVDPKLPIKRVRQRLYRGYCATQGSLPDAVELFVARRDSIEALYRDPIGQLLRPRTVKATLDYFDEFYRTIVDPRKLARETLDVCLHTG